MLGLAVGDALGAPVEFMRRSAILELYGEAGIQEFEAWGGQPAGSYTDDTQMSVATARGVLDWQETSGWSLSSGDRPSSTRSRSHLEAVPGVGAVTGVPARRTRQEVPRGDRQRRAQTAHHE